MSAELWGVVVVAAIVLGVVIFVIFNISGKRKFCKKTEQIEIGQDANEVRDIVMKDYKDYLVADDNKTLKWEYYYYTASLFHPHNIYIALALEEGKVIHIEKNF